MSGHENHHLDQRALLLTAAWSGAILLAMLAVVYLLWRRLVPPAQTVPASMVPPAPRLLPDPARERHAVERAQISRLESWGWVDHAHGIAHIPIRRAMQRVAASASAEAPAGPAPAGTAATAAEAASHRPGRAR
ncbi:hypothetical protein QMK61_00030 [Fulvimonas sp. R45]|uniref:hypothetical protein n=1 Tax=Fulvimonas sp. R45 TaxID=3045937 RepID=UPI00265EE468|nr:hypothetical protein [Fulvimonas sp. R45]MDO1527207.1 hypothetical protein [Fulvimonas sp. R45]